MQAISLTIAQRASQALAPASGPDLVRLQDLQSALTGYAVYAHTHASADILNFSTGVLAVLSANGVALSGTGPSLLTNGGLKFTGNLLGIDSGIVSLVGHKHVATDITNWTTALDAWAALRGLTSGTGAVNLLPNGGLKTTGGLLGVDSGIVSLVGHKHVVADLLDFSAGVIATLVANNVPLSGVPSVLLSNGGLKYTGGALGVDSGVVSLVGHKHLAADITNLAAAVLAIVSGVPTPLPPLLANGGLRSVGGALAADSGVVSLVGHTQPAASIYDFTAAVQSILSGTPSSSLPGLVTNGGLKYTGTLLGVDSGIVSLVGHKHVVADLTDFSAGVMATLGANNVPLSGVPVSLLANGGLKYTGTQLGVDSGIVSLAGHTHAQLHNPVTLGAMSTISGTLNGGQQLQVEAVLVAGGGLLATPSGLQVNWALTPVVNPSLALSVADTATVDLTLAGSLLTAAVIVDPSPPSGGGLIVAGVNGLRVSLGGSGTQAAAGNHTHAVVTSGTDGFMRANDKIRLDGLYAGSGANTIAASNTIAPSGSGPVYLNVIPAPGGALTISAAGLAVSLGGSGTQAAAGNHTHTVATSGTAGFQSATDKLQADLLWFATGGNLSLFSGTLVLYGPASAPGNSGAPTAWWRADVNGTSFRVPLYL